MLKRNWAIALIIVIGAVAIALVWSGVVQGLTFYTLAHEPVAVKGCGHRHGCKTHYAKYKGRIVLLVKKR